MHNHPNNLSHGNMRYPLRHLNPRDLSVLWASPGRVTPYKINLECSNHCYTETCRQDSKCRQPSVTPCTIIKRHKRAKGRHFHKERYESSLLIPSIFARLCANPSFFVFESKSETTPVNANNYALSVNDLLGSSFAGNAEETFLFYATASNPDPNYDKSIIVVSLYDKNREKLTLGNRFPFGETIS